MRIRRFLLTVGLTSALVVGPLAGLAAAHVEVTSPGATEGEEGVLTFRVPTEKDVPTVKVEVVMPTDTPLTDVLISPKAGWTYALTMAKPSKPLTNEDGNPVTEIVSRVTWTATNGGIKPNEFDQFQVLADPLPKASQLTFKALQTYGDGSVVSWIQEPVAGAPDPDFPAPVLALAAGDEPADAVGADDRVPTSSSTSTVLGSIALGVGILALLGVGWVLIGQRRRAAR